MKFNIKNNQRAFQNHVEQRRRLHALSESLAITWNRYINVILTPVGIEGHCHFDALFQASEGK